MLSDLPSECSTVLELRVTLDSVRLSIIYMLINYSIAIYYEDPQVYDKVSTRCFSQSLFPSSKSLFESGSAICLLAGCSPRYIFVHFVHYSSGCLLIESNVNSTSECAPQNQHHVLWDELAE